MEQITAYISQLLSSNEFLQGGAILGALTWLGYQLKTIPNFLWNKFRYYATYTVHFDQQSDFYRVFSEWLHENHPQKFRNVEITFNNDNRASDETVQPGEEPESRKTAKLNLRQYDDSNLVFYQNRWLWVRKQRREMNNVKDLVSLFYQNYSISGLFAKNAITALTDEILERKNSEIKPDKIRLYFGKYDYFGQKALPVVKTLDHLFFEQKDELLEDLDLFIERKDFYKEKGINFKRSYLLYGRGGTGKTSIAIAIADYLKYDLYLINLAGIKDDKELERLSSNIRSRAVILLEDIDCVLNQREVKSKRLNFSTVLNFLDGLYAPTDCIFVMTTNKPEKLDEALTRKGRVDLALHIDYPNRAEIEEFMSDFYEIDITLNMFDRSQIPMSEIQDICLKNKVSADAIRAIKTKQPTNGHKKAGQYV